MPIQDPNRVYDGYFSLEGGMDDGRLPHLIGKNQCQTAENAIFRGGGPTNRPPFLERPLTFENPNLTYGDNGIFLNEDGDTPQSLTVFLEHNFQGANYYAPSGGKECIMAMLGGRLYRITPGAAGVQVREIILSRRNRANIPIAYMVQADTYLIAQDGEGAPIIFDGSTARRAIPGEIFTGTIMGYGLGRIILIGTDGQVYFGDIFNGKGNGGADVLGFTETTFLNEGFPSALPPSMGNPTAIIFLPQQDAATGIGDCLIFGEKGAEAFTLSLPRETWKDSQFQREALRSIGCTGHRNIAVINNDIWFRASDGWRSYRQARAEVDKWAQLPESTNVSRWTNSDTSWLLKYGSATAFDNRLLATCTPVPDIDRPYHNGMLSCDFNVLSSFGNASDPAWDGHWTERTISPMVGLKATQLVEGMFGGEHRAFVFYIDGAGHNAILEIQREAYGNDTAGPITSEIALRSMDFDSPMNEKRLYGGDIWVDQVQGQGVQIGAFYRPDQIADFIPWDGFTLSGTGEAGAITPGGVPTATLGYAPRRSLQKPADTADPVTNRLYRRGYEIQPKLRWTGRARLRRMRVHAQEELENFKATV